MCSIEASAVNTPVEEQEGGQKEEEDDEGLNIKHKDTDVKRPIVAPRWPTRVFAIECMLKIMTACEGNEAHFQLATAKALKQKGRGRTSCTICHCFLPKSINPVSKAN